MRIRHLAFLPLATVMGGLVLATAASLVSALERSVLFVPEVVSSIPVSRHETDCERLFREAHALSHEATSCAAQPVCAGSPLLCPAAQDVEIEREYERLRTALHAQCAVPLHLMDFAWGGPAGDARGCGGVPEWEAAVSGESEPMRFVF